MLQVLSAQILEDDIGRSVRVGHSPHDNLVAPQETSVLPWAKNIAIPGRGHVDILGSALLVEILVAELRGCGATAGP